MKRSLCLPLVCWLLVSGCATPTKNTVFQISTIDALLAGVYDGAVSCRELANHGNFGIGTFDRLDGEMILLDGKMYQVKADGKIYSPSPTLGTPFATVCQFTEDKCVPVQAGSDFESIKTLIDNHAPNQNVFCAIRISGQFASMRTRSVPAQAKPYPPLSAVTRKQPEFQMKNVSGTIVGFRCPAYMKGVNVPGYHLHFISRDGTQGGHVLSFDISNAECRLDTLDQYFLKLPADAESFAETDLSKDRSKELKDVEE